MTASVAAILLVGAGALALRAGPPEAGAATVSDPATAPAEPRPRVDTRWLAHVLGEAGVVLPRQAAVYLAVVPEGATRPTAEYAAGGGPLASDLWPASSIKPLVALGALDRLATWGFTGAATVAVEGWSGTVIDLAHAAIRDSSNEAYDLLVQLAGVDWLNDDFLTPSRGFPVTVVQRTYTGGDLHVSPAMTLTEGDRILELDERLSERHFGLDDDANRSNLREMTEAVRLITLHREGAGVRRLGLDPVDLDSLRDALHDAEGFMAPGVLAALGPDAEVYAKPGWVGGEACLDVGLVVSPSHRDRYLLGVALPDQGDECASIASVAEVILQAITRA